MRPIAVTAGDAAGIGIEIALKALAAAEETLRPILIGPENLLREAAHRLRLSIDNIQIRDTGALPVHLLFAGRNHPETGDASWNAVRTGVDLVLAGEASALVTAPISKKAWRLAGHGEPGHTELVGKLTGARPIMAFYGHETCGSEPGPTLMVALATVHLPLRDVAGRLTADDLSNLLSELDRELREKFAIERPRIAVAGLNPHAGEDGLLGNEEQTILAPAIAAARARAIDVSGPWPADALFRSTSRASHDLILAMYHDQGLAPFKALCGEHGVNVTLGTPIIRTSPDHGTAFDIAGRGVASYSSMAAAIKLARRLASRKRGA